MPDSISSAQHGSTYVDSRGEKSDFPLGDLSFVDEVVSFDKGTPTSAEKYCNSSQVLGQPDYLNDYQEPPGYVTLGCGGKVIVRFIDNVLVDGHTDNMGSEEYNQELSKNRASSVRDYLSKVEVLENIRMDIYGYGESRPISTNATEEGREKNRRIEILIIP